MGTLGVSDSTQLPALNKAGHVAHCVRCLDGLPASLVEMDASRYVSFFPSPSESIAAYMSDLYIPTGLVLGFGVSEWLSRFIVWVRSTLQA